MAHNTNTEGHRQLSSIAQALETWKQVNKTVSSFTIRAYKQKHRRDRAVKYCQHPFTYNR